ncbi:MAG: ECF transporter S component [Lachnospiraceae bacterium]|nr:ECF transporter S component [Lachnospiraceae bacterium]
MRLTKKICFIACFIALFILLDKVSVLIPMVNVRITTRNLPLYIGGYIYGPFIGAIIGLLGMIVSQLNYAIDLMSILFLLPQTIIGFLTGFLAKKKILDFDNKKKSYIVVMIILNVLLSLINTVCIFFRYM